MQQSPEFIFALSGDPDVLQAAMHVMNGDAPGALEILKQHAAGERWQAPKRTVEALAHLQQLELEPAEQCARAAVTSHPDSWMAWVILIASLQLRRRLPEAIAACRQSLAVYPLAGLGPFLLGTLLEQNRQCEEAVEAYESAIRENPTLEKAYYRLAVTHMRLGDSDTSAKVMKDGLKTNPAIPRRILLANIHEQEGDYEAAFKELKYAVGIVPQPSTKFRLACLYYALGRIEESMALHEELVAEAPRKWENLLALAGACADQGRFADAIDYYQKTLKIVPGFTKALLGLTDAYLAEGKTEEARSTLQTALEVFPNHPEVERRLAALPPPEETTSA